MTTLGRPAWTANEQQNPVATNTIMASAAARRGTPHINAVFAALDREGIHIGSMRNRANRLEEMFVNLVEGAA